MLGHAPVIGAKVRDLHRILDSCDLPVEVPARATIRMMSEGFLARGQGPRSLNSDRTVLTIIASQDLELEDVNADGSKIQASRALKQNHEHWMLPETLRLADYGLATMIAPTTTTCGKPLRTAVS